MADSATAPLKRAAEYVRMSTDHQKYSILNQRAAIAVYAEAHGYEVVRSFADAGKSGLTLRKRDALKMLLSTVISGEADFDTLLVYDVSRWGRFQDTDEAGHYEFLCRSNGVKLVYCAELFDNDGTPLSAIYKAIKRGMASEYSRELSVKVSASKARMAALGYTQGGPPGFGFRRLLVDEAGRPRAILEPGQRKAIRSDRIRITLGPPEEVAIVHRIYDLFLDENQSITGIAHLLNMEGHRYHGDKPWDRYRVIQILTHEKYIGNLVSNRRSERLGAKSVPNPPEQWIRVVGAFEGIIDPERFARVQTILSEVHWSGARLLEGLRSLQEKHGRVSAALLAKAGLPTRETYARRFGSLSAAYRLAGVATSPAASAAVALRLHRRAQRIQAGDELPPKGRKPSRHRGKQEQIARREAAEEATIASHYLTDEEVLDRLRRLLSRCGRLSGPLIAAADDVPNVATFRTRFGGLTEAYRLIGYQPPMGRTWSLEARTRIRDEFLRLRTEDPGRYRQRFARACISKEVLLERLSLILSREGRITVGLMESYESTPSPNTYRARFGSMYTAYRLAGYEPNKADYRGISKKYLEAEIAATERLAT